MDFKDCFKQLTDRVSALKDQIQTEEATKNAFIMPFIQMLGYDVFNPTEVVPEMDCDLIKKKGEKIDYAIMKDGEPIMLVECKHWRQDLNLHDNQLQKYFVASKAKFGVLTNGVRYRFYTDLVKPNIMDDVPFLEVDMENVKDSQVEEVKKFHKSYFDVDNILSSASELKYTSELKSAIKMEFENPSSEMVKMLTKRVYDGIITQKVLDQFTELVKCSFQGHINDEMSNRLKIAINTTESLGAKSTASSPSEAEETGEKDTPNDYGIVTTEEELEGFYIIKSILRTVMPADRITYRDAQRYFAVFADDNNRRPICRLYFNTANKRIGLFDADKNEVRYSLQTLDDIFLYQDQLRAFVAIYMGGSCADGQA